MRHSALIGTICNCNRVGQCKFPLPGCHWLGLLNASLIYPIVRWQDLINPNPRGQHYARANQFAWMSLQIYTLERVTGTTLINFRTCQTFAVPVSRDLSKVTTPRRSWHGRRRMHTRTMDTVAHSDHVHRYRLWYHKLLSPHIYQVECA